MNQYRSVSVLCGKNETIRFLRITGVAPCPELAGQPIAGLALLAALPYGNVGLRRVSSIQGNTCKFVVS